MLPTKLKALDDYINEALYNGWIRESKSPTSIPIGIDIYSIVDLISKSFVSSFGLSPYINKKH